MTAIIIILRIIAFGLHSITLCLLNGDGRAGGHNLKQKRGISHLTYTNASVTRRITGVVSVMNAKWFTTEP